MIDPHVHLRDWTESDKETLVHAFYVAWRCGISALFEMPNTNPPLTARNAVLRRIADADRARRSFADQTAIHHKHAILGATRNRVQSPLSAPFHGLYAGLTADPDQVRHAAAVHGELFPRVVGCKLYAGHSTGHMGVTTVAAQSIVWRTLASAGYRGVVAVHAEREDLLRPEIRNPDDPLTHGASRPPLAEIASVQTQLTLAEAAGFRGTLHVCHVSTPEALEIITRERAGLPFTVTAGVTPHHLLLDSEYAAASVPGPRDLPGARGSGFTVNPPLRDRSARERLLAAVLAGEADWIESDHAPHTWADKLDGAAGLPGIPAFRCLCDYLGRTMDHDTVRRMTSTRVLEVFGIDPGLVPRNPAASGPFGREEYGLLAREYPWDPYTGGQLCR
ncbi:MAG: dihydroorotase [Spirochaetaceae bacterium]|nr:MAG: dihydroorotase [Spirochaetaceae bacterium]